LAVETKRATFSGGKSDKNGFGFYVETKDRKK
jgi:hypothetical protein